MNTMHVITGTENMIKALRDLHTKRVKEGEELLKTGEVDRELVEAGTRALRLCDQGIALGEKMLADPLLSTAGALFMQSLIMFLTVPELLDALEPRIMRLIAESGKAYANGADPSDAPDAPDADHTDDPCTCGDPDCSRPMNHLEGAEVAKPA